MDVKNVYRDQFMNLKKMQTGDLTTDLYQKKQYENMLPGTMDDIYVGIQYHSRRYNLAYT